MFRRIVRTQTEMRYQASKREVEEIRKRFLEWQNRVERIYIKSEQLKELRKDLD